MKSKRQQQKKLVHIMHACSSCTDVILACFAFCPIVVSGHEGLLPVHNVHACLLCSIVLLVLLVVQELPVAVRLVLLLLQCACAALYITCFCLFVFCPPIF